MEIEKRKGHRQGGGREGGGDGGSQEAGQAGAKPLGEAACKEVDPGHGGKGELKAHASDDPGILRQQQEPRAAQGGGHVVFPVDKAPAEQDELHHRRPAGRRGGAGEQGEEHHQRHAQNGGELG